MPCWTGPRGSRARKNMEPEPGEFDLIRRFFVRGGTAARHPEVLLGIGDDAALIDLPRDSDLAVGGRYHRRGAALSR